MPIRATSDCFLSVTRAVFVLLVLMVFRPVAIGIEALRRRLLVYIKVRVIIQSKRGNPSST